MSGSLRVGPLLRTWALIGVAAQVLVAFPDERWPVVDSAAARAAVNDAQGDPAIAVRLGAGTWAPDAGLAAGTRAVVRVRPEGRDGAVRALLLDWTGEAGGADLLALELPNGARGRAQLLRCPKVRVEWRGRWAPGAGLGPDRARRAALAPSPVAGAAALSHLPGAARERAGCYVAMAFTLDDPHLEQWDPEHEYTLAVEVDSGRVRLWLEGALFQWDDPSPFQAIFLKVGVAGMAAHVSVHETQRPQPQYDRSNMWCVIPHSCRCMPGYTGDYCTELCPEGSFGESCGRSCGKCLGGGGCDPLRGACPLGCQPGYAPPLCVEEVVRLTGAPTVRVLNASALEVLADARLIKGSGTPRAAVVQYRVADGLKSLHGDAWQSLPALPLGLGPTVRAVVAALRPGTSYNVRVLLEAEDGARSPHAPVAQQATSCEVPGSFDYKVIAYVDPHLQKTNVKWMATGAGVRRCSVHMWRLRLRAPAAAWERELDLAQEHRHALMEVPPAAAELTVVALTPHGSLPASRPVAVFPSHPELGPVQELAVAQQGSRTATLTWRPPACCPDAPLSYIVTLQCETLVHCFWDCSGDGQRVIRVKPGDAPQLTFSGLRPDARYRAVVVAHLDGSAPGTELVFDTLPAAPGVRLQPEWVQLRALASRSVELSWQPPRDCSLLHGGPSGVHYVLRPAAVPRWSGNEADGVFSGQVYGQRHRFNHLQPATAYVVTLHLMTAGQWDPALAADFNVTTLPEGAEALRVHETQRERVALRWLPRNGTGVVGVMVTRRAHGGADEMAPVWSAPCERWPQMRCLEMSGLLPDTRYDLWVHIKTRNESNNQLLDETVRITTRTTEGVPSAPRELRAEATSAMTLRVRWLAPAQRGGVLRNFVVAVHHLRSLAVGACCQRNRVAVVDVLPADALKMDHFEHEVTGLPPASTFLVSVLAVTASPGAVANVTAHTAPLPPSAAEALQLLQAPGSCLRAHLPPAARLAADAALATVRRLFTFLAPWEGELSLGGTVVRAGNATAFASPLPQALLKALPRGYAALQEVKEAGGGTVCVDGAGRGGQRAGVALLLEYEGAASAAVWLSAAFDLLDCFHATQPPAAYVCL